MQTTDTMTAEPVRYSPLCPDWCTSSGYQHEENTHVITEERRPVVDHEGPAFGRFYVTGVEFLLSDAPLRLEVHDDSQGEEFTASDLRKLAADALAAAEWLDPTPAHPGVLGAVEEVARERGITLAELATVAGVELESLTAADLTKLFMTLTYWEQRLAEHLLRVMESA